jgi:hypothetical protein
MIIEATSKTVFSKSTHDIFGIGNNMIAYFQPNEIILFLRLGSVFPKITAQSSKLVVS